MSLALLLLATVAAAAAAPPPSPQCAGDTNGHVTSSATLTAMPEPMLVPWPAAIAIEPGYFYPNASTVIALQVGLLRKNATNLALLHRAGELLAAEISLVTSGALSPKVVDEDKYLPGPNIHLSLDGSGGTFDNVDGSSTRIEAHGAVLSGGSYTGLMSATSTLLQVLEMGSDTDGRKAAACTSGPAAWRAPVIDVEDKPAFGIRGVMVDAARTYLPLSLLKEYVVLCRLYKLNHLHIHFSDGGIFTFPSTKYPQLSAKAKWKYTLAEMQELQAFAVARGVVIIGEVDVPGHASGLTGALPSVFAFKSKPSVGIIDFVSPAVVAAIQTIFDEIEAVFPSGFVMMGGDEVNLGSIASLPEIKAAASKIGPNATGYDCYRLFIAEMHTYAKKAGRELVVWEGFAPAEGQTGRSAHPASSVEIPTDVIVTPFDCFYYPPPQLASDGYRILNAAWTPLYIAGGSGQSPELIYSWNPWLLGEFPGHVSWWKIPAAHRSSIIGVKMAVWSTEANDTLCALSGRVPAMADRSWNPAAARTYRDYQVRVSHTTKILGMLLGRGGGGPSPDAPPPPPPPLPAPAAAGFVGHVGQCRDKENGYGARLEHNGAVNISTCQAMCLAQGAKCDAYDYGDGAWCGIWGRTFTPSDNCSAFGLKWTWATGSNAAKNLPVCHGHGGVNSCYTRKELDCTAASGSSAPPVGCVAGCTPSQCWKGGI